MIIKSKGMSIKAIARLIEYILRDGSQLLDANGKALFIKQNLRGKTPKEWTREFVLNEETRKIKNKRARGLYHCIISLHPKDSEHISLQMLESIARQFIKLRSPNSLVVATAHQDEHIHLHVIISGVEFGSGKSIRVEKSEFNNILKNMQLYQEANFPELEFSKVELGKKKP